ncbi:hypothetical protein ACA910_019357 [Epithemia clementina (nom. ined.)]
MTDVAICRNGSAATSSRASSLLSDLPRRLTTICVGVPILWIIWSFSVTRHLFFQGSHVVMCWEWCTLSKMDNLSRFAFLTTSLAIANVQDDEIFVVLLIICVACSSFVSGSITPSAMLSTTAGFLLISAPNRAWLAVSGDFYSTVSLLLTVWNADTGALLAGRLGVLVGTNWPRPRWLRNVSQAKSVEGLMGGLIGGTLTYWSLPLFWSLIHRYNLAFQHLSSLHSPVVVVGVSSNLFARSVDRNVDLLLTGAILSIAAILGDLWESSLKRSFGVKDSGKLLPGHGGVLDRFDSSLLAAMVYKHLLKAG